MERVLAIGSHYDDIEFGCGGSLIEHKKKGDAIILAVLNSDDSLSGDPIIRNLEQNDSCRILNSKLLRFRKDDKVENIVRILDNEECSIIYMSHKVDYHQDHQKGYIVGQAVGRNIHISMMSYFTPTSYNYYPQVFKKIDMKEKIELLKCFKSQLKRRPDYLATLIAQNHFFGTLIGEEAAEGFTFHRMVIK